MRGGSRRKRTEPRFGRLIGNVRAVLGAAAREGGVEFEVWAPRAARVDVRLGSDVRPLEPRDGGLFSAVWPARAGDDYMYVLDGRDQYADPCSREQPEGVRGPSRVVNVDAPAAWAGVALDELVLYELHVGTFTDEGTFDAAARHLRELVDLGVTAIEVMPIATFPGSRNWGYDGLFAYAPHSVYGGPAGFARLVAAAHTAGLGVILDVVYNHVGPGSELLRAFGPYFTDRRETPWGDALDYSQLGVREWAIQNAEMWVRDYGVDGVRLDAAHSVFDESEEHVLAELAARVRAIDRRALVIAEIESGDERPIREWGHDAQWADEFHHELHALLTLEREGYYARYGSLEGLAAQLRRRPAERLVFCSQNHDQVGNRAFGDRPGKRELALRAALLLFAPQTPLLFMGEEYGERRPFQFFTDHIDPAIAEATREGRRREFADFVLFAGAELPDPQDEATFLRSKLDRSEADRDLREFYRKLLSLRRDLPREVDVVVEGDVLRAKRGPVELVADFGMKTVDLRR